MKGSSKLESNSELSAVDPFDPVQFAASGTIVDGFGIVKEMVACPVRRAGKQEFFRIHPGEEFQLRAFILEFRDEGETYLVMPGVAAELPGETRLVSLRLAVTRQGSIFLFPIPEPKIDGRETGWGPSLRAATAKAEKDWVRVIANMNQGAYDVYVAPSKLGNPVWPEKSMRDILAIAFGESFIIRDGGHPVIKRLLGQF